MTYRDDIPDVMVLITEFQAFDHGEATTVSIPEEYNPQPGETINWECAQFQGTAEIISRNGKECIIKKLS